MSKYFRTLISLRTQVVALESQLELANSEEQALLKDREDSDKKGRKFRVGDKVQNTSGTCPCEVGQISAVNASPPRFTVKYPSGITETAYSGEDLRLMGTTIAAGLDGAIAAGSFHANLIALRQRILEMGRKLNEDENALAWLLQEREDSDSGKPRAFRVGDKVRVPTSWLYGTQIGTITQVSPTRRFLVAFAGGKIWVTSGCQLELFGAAA